MTDDEPDDPFADVSTDDLGYYEPDEVLALVRETDDPSHGEDAVFDAMETLRANLGALRDDPDARTRDEYGHLDAVFELATSMVLNVRGVDETNVRTITCRGAKKALQDAGDDGGLRLNLGELREKFDRTKSSHDNGLLDLVDVFEVYVDTVIKYEENNAGYDSRYEVHFTDDAPVNSNRALTLESIDVVMDPEAVTKRFLNTFNTPVMYNSDDDGPGWPVTVNRAIIEPANTEQVQSKEAQAADLLRKKVNNRPAYISGTAAADNEACYIDAPTAEAADEQGVIWVPRELVHSAAEAKEVDDVQQQFEAYLKKEGLKTGKADNKTATDWFWPLARETDAEDTEDSRLFREHAIVPPDEVGSYEFEDDDAGDDDSDDGGEGGKMDLPAPEVGDDEDGGEQ